MKKITAANLKKYSYWTSVIVIGIVIGVSLQFVKAWTEPNVLAPGGNLSAPINTSIAGQIKTGGLVLNTGGTSLNGLIMQNGNVGIGTVNPQKKLDIAGDAVVSSGNLDIGLEEAKKTCNQIGVNGVGCQVGCPVGKSVITGTCVNVRCGENYPLPVDGDSLSNPFESKGAFSFSSLGSEGWACYVSNTSDGVADGDSCVTATAICARVKPIIGLNPNNLFSPSAGFGQ